MLAKLRDSEGRLLRTYAGGEAKLLAYLDDYAFFIDGLIALHQATGDERWLASGRRADWPGKSSCFGTIATGGFFYTSTLHEPLIARSKLPTDGVTPSGNSVSAANLLYLAAARDKPDYAARAEQCIQAAAPLLEENPAAAPQVGGGNRRLAGLGRRDRPPRHPRSETAAVLLFKKKFLPAIRSGEKTQTIRLWNVCRMKSGQRSYIPGAGYIRVISVEPVELPSLTDADAVPDGFASADALRNELATLYADVLAAGHRAYRIRFELLDEEEQKAAVAARRAAKLAGK